MFSCAGKGVYVSMIHRDMPGPPSIHRSIERFLYKSKLAHGKLRSLRPGSELISLIRERESACC